MEVVVGDYYIDSTGIMFKVLQKTSESLYLTEFESSERGDFSRPLNYVNILKFAERYSSAIIDRNLLKEDKFYHNFSLDNYDIKKHSRKIKDTKIARKLNKDKIIKEEKGYIIVEN